MTFLGSSKVRSMENELRMWWRLSQRGWALVRTDPTNFELAELKDEIEVMHDMSEWPGLKAAIRRGLEVHDKLGLPNLDKADVA